MVCEQEHHCPFLNRHDTRCAEHFHLDRLEHAFAYCFDRYQACPVYVERLRERRVMRQELEMDAVGVGGGMVDRESESIDGQAQPQSRLFPVRVRRPASTRIVQISIAGRHALPAAGAA